MDFKLRILLINVIAVFLIGSCNPSKKWLEFEPRLKILDPPPEHWQNYENRDTPNWTRQYAFCSCFYYALELEDKSLKKRMLEIDFSMGSLFDLTMVGSVPHELIDSLALKAAKTIVDPKTYAGMHTETVGDRKAIISGCLDFSRSKSINDIMQEEIDRVIKARREANRKKHERHKYK